MTIKERNEPTRSSTRSPGKPCCWIHIYLQRIRCCHSYHYRCNSCRQKSNHIARGTPVAIAIAVKNRGPLTNTFRGMIAYNKSTYRCNRRRRPTIIRHQFGSKHMMNVVGPNVSRNMKDGYKRLGGNWNCLITLDPISQLHWCDWNLEKEQLVRFVLSQLTVL